MVYIRQMASQQGLYEDDPVFARVLYTCVCTCMKPYDCMVLLLRMLFETGKVQGSGAAAHRSCSIEVA